MTCKGFEDKAEDNGRMLLSLLLFRLRTCRHPATQCFFPNDIDGTAVQV